MDKRYIRSTPIFGEDGQQRLNDANVAVFGLGGVGSFAVEALVRAGVGTLTLIDNDEYSLSNLNRQLYATEKTIGVKKTETAKSRILEINSKTNVNVINEFVLDGKQSDVNFNDFDYVIDAIDTMSGKLSIIKNATKYGVKIISCMSAGNKLDATKFKVADIFDTKVCPMCKVMRKLLKENNIDALKVVYSEEEPIKIPKESLCFYDETKNGRRAPFSVSFVPSVMGLIAAGEAIKDIARGKIIK